jgi:anti-sigma factor RsiW
LAQQLRRRFSASLNGHIECRLARVVLCEYVSSRIDEQSNEIFPTPLRRTVQGRRTRFRLRMNIRAHGEEALKRMGIRVPFARGQMERTLTLIVLGIHICAAVQQEHDNRVVRTRYRPVERRRVVVVRATDRGSGVEQIPDRV